MELREFGRLAKSHPKIRAQYDAQELAEIDSLPDELAAKLFLDQNPDHWDLISPAARRIRNLAAKDTTPKYWLPWFKTNEQLDVDTQRRIETIACEARMLHEMEMLMEASSSNVPVESLPQIAVMREQHRLAIEMLRENRDHLIKTYEIKRQYELGPNVRNVLPAVNEGAEREVLEEEDPEPGGNGLGAAPADVDGDEIPDPPRVRRKQHAASRKPGGKKNPS